MNLDRFSQPITQISTTVEYHYTCECGKKIKSGFIYKDKTYCKECMWELLEDELDIRRIG